MNFLIFPHVLYFFKILFVYVLLLLSEIVVTVLFKIVLKTLFGDSDIKLFNQRVEYVNLLFI